jgi:hypothetical protein
MAERQPFRELDLASLIGLSVEEAVESVPRRLGSTGSGSSTS